MKQSSLLLFLFIMLGSAASAQRHEPLNPQKDRKQMGAFTILLRNAPGDTYLFDILKNNKPLEPFAPVNPITLLPEGFSSKEDAFKAAGWLVEAYQKRGHLPPTIPPHEAEKLNLPLHKLLKQPKH